METKTNVHARMSLIKAELSKCKIPKSGHNKYSGFKYHELTDFMPFVNELNHKWGINATPKFLKKQGVCILSIVNVEDKEDKYEIIIPYVEAQMLAKGGAPSIVDEIQRLGSTLTYNRRYLYMSAYDIVESDGIDSLPIGDEPPAVKTITNENFAKGVDKVNKGEMFVPELEKALSGYALTKEQQQIINQLKTAK
jgi:hypothetical protein